MMRICDRQNISQVLALVRMSCGGGWYGVACGTAMLTCSRCHRPRKALASPLPAVPLVCVDCFPLVERELAEGPGTLRVGERVQLVSCAGPGTITSFARGKALVRFDDWPESLQAIRLSSLQRLAGEVGA